MSALNLSLTSAMLLFLFAGCHPKEGDTYLDPATGGKYNVTYVGTCEEAELHSDDLRRILAERAGSTWEPIEYDNAPSAECVAFWLDDGNPLTFQHLVAPREQFVQRLVLER